MKIIELKIQGYRSLKDITWKPNDLNILIGPNGSGKSNLLRILELINASADKRLAKHVQAEGGMQPMIWDGEAKQIAITLKTSPVELEHSSIKRNLTYKLDLERLGKTSSYRIGIEQLASYDRDGKKQRSEPVKILERDGQHSVVFDDDEEKGESGTPVEDTESLLSFGYIPFGYGSSFLYSFQWQLSNWSIYPEFQAGKDAPARRGIVSCFDKHLESDGANLVSVLHTLYTGNREFKQDIDEAMQAAFGADFEELVFPPEADQRIQLRIRWKSLSRPQSAADISDGTLRFLYLLAILANPDPPALIAIDEPEMGLHPSMLRIIAEYAVDASSRSQVILTTHSPEFMDAFRETIPKITVVEWKDGQTQLRILSGDALSQWVKEYSLGEILRTNEADVIEEEPEE